MADDIFLSQEEQDERAKKWLKDNGLAIGVGIALGFGAIFGYNQYKANIVANAESASTLFASALNAVRDSENANIDAQFNDLKANHADSSYASKVVLMKAAQLTNSDYDAAYNELEWVVNNAPEVGLVHTARIRQVKINIAKGELDKAAALATQSSYDGFDSHYHELLGDISALKGDNEAAATSYQSAIDSLGASDAAYSRIIGLKRDRLPVSSDSQSQ